MSDSFESVRLSTIATAFAMAHRYAAEGATNQERARFRAVAKLIWDACGEQQPMPNVLPANLAALGTANETDAEGMLHAGGKA